MITAVGTPSDRLHTDGGPSPRWTGRKRALAVDTTITLLILIMVGLEYAFPFDDGTHAGDQRLSLVLSLLTVAPLAVRRIWPLRAFLAMCAVAGLPGLLVAHTFLFFGGQLPLMLGLATVFRYHRIRIALVSVAAVAMTIGLLLLHDPDDNPWANLLFVSVFMLVAAIIGAVLRRSAVRRERLAEVLADVRRATAVRDAMAVLDERSRVARDLHDVVAHAVSLMLVQAGAARLALADGDADVAGGFLAGVEQTGAGAERELDAMLRALRTDAATANEIGNAGEVATDPGPGTGGRRREPGTGPAAERLELADLVDRMRAAGLDIAFRTIGTRPDLSPGLELAIYRIVQEGLTNVLRHAGPTEVELTVDLHHPLTVTMIDSGPRGPRPVPARSGQGLIGMAERVGLFGGTLQCEPLARGWLLRVRLPLTELVR